MAGLMIHWLVPLSSLNFFFKSHENWRKLDSKFSGTPFKTILDPPTLNMSFYQKMLNDLPEIP
jgi:hypothetical protein